MKKYIVAYIKAYVDIACVAGITYLFYTCYKGRSPIADYLVLLTGISAFSGPLSLLFRKAKV